MASSTKTGRAVAVTGTGNDWTGYPDVQGLSEAEGLLYAESTASSATATKTLLLTNFGFAIPSSATITNVEVNGVVATDVNNLYWSHRLYYGGAGQGGALGKVFQTAQGLDTWVPYTLGSLALWELTSAALMAVVNTSGFGFTVYAYTTGATTTIYVDYLDVTITYTDARGGAPRRQTRRGYCGRGYGR